MRTSLLWCVGILAVACGGGDDVSFGSGGSAGTAGQGGSSVGGSAQGGSSAGGSAQGGSAAGGSAQGGSAAGGSAQGGSAAGGSSAGGSAAGGSAQGGSAGQGAQGGTAGQGAQGGTAGQAGSAGAGAGGSAGSTSVGGSAGMSTGGTGGSTGTLEGLLMSEYVEGYYSNKAIELFNGTSSTIDLSACELVFSFAGSANQAHVPISNAPAPGFQPNDTWVICDDGASEALLNACDQKSDVQFFFNGDDAIELVCGGRLIDSFGKVGEDPGDGWGDPNAVTFTRDHTLRRKCSVTRGDTNSGDDFHPAVGWDGFGANQIDGLGHHYGN